jgi:hypothetical protein
MSHPEPPNHPVRTDGRSTTSVAAGKPEFLDIVLGRLDLIAIVLLVVGIFALLTLVAVFAVVALADNFASVWANPYDRWLIGILTAAAVWVVARWKKLCVF